MSASPGTALALALALARHGMPLARHGTARHGMASVLAGSGQQQCAQERKKPTVPSARNELRSDEPIVEARASAHAHTRTLLTYA